MCKKWIAYVQNGVVHIALVTAAPPPSAVAAAPRPLLYKICEIFTKSFQGSKVFIHIMNNVSPRSGRIVCPASADAEKRTAPPPMIPNPFTEMRRFKVLSPLNILNIFFYLQGSLSCKLKMEAI